MLYKTKMEARISKESRNQICKEKKLLAFSIQLSILKKRVFYSFWIRYL